MSLDKKLEKKYRSLHSPQFNEFRSEFPEQKSLTTYRFLNMNFLENIIPTLITNSAPYISPQLFRNKLPEYLPQTDLDLIKVRQEVIKSFIEDYSGPKELFKHIQMIAIASQLRHEKVEFSLMCDALSRYKNEAMLFFDKLSKIHPEITKYHQEKISQDKIQTTLDAYDAGGYNFISISFNNKGFEAQGILDKTIKSTKKSTIYLKGDFKITNKELLIHNIINEQYNLDKALGLIPLLYGEAIYYVERQKQGLPACIPNINNNQEFEMIEGEPISRLSTKAIGTDISYSGKTSRIILNGLHSGGKSVMLYTIPHYIIIGLTGGVLPAREANIPLTKEIINSFEVKWHSYQGKLASELDERASVIKKLNPQTIYICDEFLQHASPDAAEFLEPIILNELKKTKSAVLIVTHRGEGISDSDWKIYHPQYKNENGEIKPTYKFGPGRPEEEALKLHASQLLGSIINGNYQSTKEEEYEGLNRDRVREMEAEYRKKLVIFGNAVRSEGYYENQ